MGVGPVRLKMKRKPLMGSIYPRLIAVLCSGLLVCFSPRTTTGIEDEWPMVLQYQALHFRNTDEISLVFRQDTVQLVVNTDSWQKETMPSLLGVFEARYDIDLSILKDRLEIYRDIHTEYGVEYRDYYTQFPTLMDIPEFRSMVAPDPEAPIISIGGKEVSSGYDYYETLFEVIRSVWDHQWSCVHCASYRIQGDSIVRAIKIVSPDGNENQHTDEFFKSSGIEEFAEIPWISGDGESIECIQFGTMLECLDFRSGIFDLPMPVQDTSSTLRPWKRRERNPSRSSVQALKRLDGET